MKGDRLKPLDPPAALRRGVGSPALFAIVQGALAASIYFGLGLVIENALALTWVVFVGATLFYGLLVLSYVEGASLHQERGGVTVLARYAFNELWSFVAGWAILLDYLILIALTAYATTDYAAVFWEQFAHGVPQYLMAAAVIVGVATLNVRGAGSRRYERTAIIVIADLGLQVVLVILGLALLFDPDVITSPLEVGGTPTVEGVLFGFTLAIAACSALDASSGLAGDVAVSRRGLRRLIAVRVPAAAIPYIGLALVASSVLPQTGNRWVEAPVLGLVTSFEQAWLREPLRYVVAVTAVALLVVACNAATLGLSRLGYSLALNRQIPSLVGRLHPTYNTPVVVIGLGAVLSLALVAPADLEFLAAIYAFGATLAFVLVHLSVLRLRVREPERDRPYKIPLNVRLPTGAELPVTAMLGLFLSVVAFASVLFFHDAARIVGPGWMVFGVVLYVVYRTSEGKPIFKRVSVPAKALTRHEVEAEFGSILVPILGTPLDDDIMQTAGRLAGEENEDLGEGGAVIEALWIFEIPMALPIDARVPEAQLRRARQALARARAVGEEYEGVEVATATVRARRAGEAIVREANRRGVEAIILAAEEPTRLRGGLRMGGKQGLHDTYVGETTRYVVQKAPCRVILTAPPASDAVTDPTRPASAAAEDGEPPVGHPVGPIN
ncbi:MAG TPA: amino acid permease [Solirubrobacteraceae bacterium]|nr:amino acid permease [Solirubrobacteraceae bacterium]